VSLEISAQEQILERANRAPEVLPEPELKRGLEEGRLLVENQAGKKVAQKKVQPILGMEMALTRVTLLF
jgi:hypothetical protein